MSNQFDFAKIVFAIEMDFEVNEIRKFVSLLSESKTSLSSRLDALHASIEADASIIDDEERHYAHDHLEDYYSSDTFAIDVGLQMSLVALYAKIEQSRSRIISLLYPCIDKSKLSKIRVVKDVLKADFPFSSIRESKISEDIRMINNDIKHSGRVSKALAKRLSLKEGTSITISVAEMQSFCSDAEKHVRSLAERAEELRTTRDLPSRRRKYVRWIRMITYDLRQSASDVFYRVARLVEP